MNEAHERLTYYIKAQGFETKDFCAEFGFVYNAFTQILTGTRPLGRKIIDQLADALPKMSVDWLLYGRGEMELSNKNISNKNMSRVEEPVKLYLPDDPGKMMMMRYLDDDDVKQKIRDILNL